MGKSRENMGETFPRTVRAKSAVVALAAAHLAHHEAVASVKSRCLETLSPEIRRQLELWGRNLEIARKRRRMTVERMAREIQVSARTYRNMEKGDPRVAVGIYAAAMTAFGLGHHMDFLADPAEDRIGQWKEWQNLPKRVRSNARPDLEF